MAQLAKPPEDYPKYKDYHSYEKYYEAEKNYLEKLKDKAPDDPENEGLEGAIVKFHVADGYAIYRVVEEDPLTIQHIPYLDAYRIPDAHVRGLRKIDILKKL